MIKRGPEACSIRRVPAAEVETAVIDQVRALVQTPEIIVRTWKEARQHDRSVTEEQVRTALAEFSALWDELFPAEQARIIQLLVERVDIQPDGLNITLRKEGLVSLANELRQKAAADERNLHRSRADGIPAAGRPQAHRRAGRHRHAGDRAAHPASTTCW